MDDPDELVEFLRARLDEVEDMAQSGIAAESYLSDLGAVLLREVEAKRQVVDYERTGDLGNLGINAWGVWRDMLKLLAMPYAEHSDYQQQWALTPA